MSQLPIRKLILYKQGIGYFERQGKIEGNRISLIVSRDGINDVLKSLTIAIHQGGQVLGIDYETPEDKQQVLNELSVKLADRASLVDLLSSLRSYCELTLLRRMERLSSVFHMAASRGGKSPRPG